MIPTWAIQIGLIVAVAAPPTHAPSASPPTSQPAATTPRPEQGAVLPAERRLRPPPLTPQQLIEHFGLIKGNNTPEARKLGATRLLETGTDEAISKLTEVLQGSPGDLAAQIAVCEAIADAEEPSAALIESLQALLGDKRPGLSDAVIHALLRFKSAAVVGRLGAMAANEAQDLEKRLAAITALGALSDRLSAVDALVGLLDDASPTVRGMALAAFRQATNTEVANSEAALQWWQTNRTMSEIDWLRRRNDQRAVEIRRITNESAALTSRLVAAYREAYNRHPEGERPRRLLALLNDSVPAVRQLSLDLVNALITDRKDISTEIKARLVDMLSDPNASVRLQTTKTVGDLRLPGAFAKLARAIAQEPEPAVRVAQANAIGRMDDPGVVQVLLDTLEDDMPVVIGEAAMALGRYARRQDGSKLGTAENITLIPEVLVERFEKVRASQDELREQFLKAMAMIGDARFRPILRTEMKLGRSVRVRRAAIAGLSGFDDIEAADAVRVCLNDPESEIRLAAADGLAKCGRRRGDLGALAEHLNPPGEPEAVVRQRAWESYLLIASQLPPEDQIKVSDEFDRPTDEVAQRRRLELLKPLAAENRAPSGGKGGTAKFEQLPKARRIEVLERMADAQWNLGDMAPAAASMEQARGLLEERSSPRSVGLAVRIIAAQLKAREDAAALKRLEDLLGELHADNKAVTALVNKVLDEVRNRLETASEAAMYADVLALLDSARPVIERAGAGFAEQLATLRKDASTRREAAIDRLLGTLGSDVDGESKLLAFPKETVLERIHEKLRPLTTTSAPANDLEVRYIQLAKRLSPNWTGFNVAATPEERAAALERLLNAAGSTKPGNGSNAARMHGDSSATKADAETNEP